MSNMEKELLQQLKKAGFGFDGREAYPTLSELIRAVGKPFYLNSDNNGFVAWNFDYKDRSQHGCGGKGKTPDIAVAKLYIVLNKK